MPPRLPVPPRLIGQTVTPATRTFTTTIRVPQASVPVTPETLAAEHRRKHDSYAIAKAKARKAANLARRQVLITERAGSLGDPVRGVETAFLRSFDTAKPLAPGEQVLATKLRTKQDPAEDSGRRNFFLNSTELGAEVERSAALSTPAPIAASDLLNDADFSGLSPKDRAKQMEEQQKTAEEAMQRITGLALGNSEDRMRVNTQRCIATFGRHKTDTHLTSVAHPSTPIASQAENVTAEEAVIPRIGPDTGSSEVQIAILTAKIRTLAGFLETRGTTDKVNKRNLRLLVHRRQKLLRYLQKKDRGGSRWQYVTQMLGLTDGTWQGEISL
ncbi:hypothetical protein LTR53_002096 [Teratosphaeriaceae sp. CCFEE 6253]|nr:hypothetical protein LTR53_002096 [Teratosphaeriaceae sp. CCFEE 6253]